MLCPLGHEILNTRRTTYSESNAHIVGFGLSKSSRGACAAVCCQSQTTNCKIRASWSVLSCKQRLCIAFTMIMNASLSEAAKFFKGDRTGLRILDVEIFKVIPGFRDLATQSRSDVKRGI